MFKISRLTDYGTVMLAHMARAPETLMKAQDIANITHIPLPTVSKIMKLLANKGVLTSFRGANGGYKLDKSPKEITIYEIITTLEGPIALTTCASPEINCEYHESCVAKGPWQYINKELSSTLQSITLEALATWS